MITGICIDFCIHPLLVKIKFKFTIPETRITLADELFFLFYFFYYVFKFLKSECALDWMAHYTCVKTVFKGHVLNANVNVETLKYNYLHGYSLSSHSNTYKIISSQRFRVHRHIFIEAGLLLKYHLELIYFLLLFSPSSISIVVFLSCRPFVVITTFSTGLVGC